MKPLVRWIIGPVYEAGFRCLARSVRELRRCYRDDIDYLICHNQLNDEQREFVEKIGVPTYEQKPTDFPVQPTYWPEDVGSLKGTRCAWKLYPPRMRPDGHEIIMDNDIIIRSRIEAVKWFMQANRPMLAQGRSRNYGYFDSMIPPAYTLNNGIIGLPPNFDFQARLLKFLPEKWDWTCFFDDQGLVVAALIDFLPMVIPSREVGLCGPNDPPPDSHGIHFVGLNSNKKHLGWETYGKRSQLL